VRAELRRALRGYLGDVVQTERAAGRRRQLPSRPFERDDESFSSRCGCETSSAAHGAVG